jgi:hypothetical protein
LGRAWIFRCSAAVTGTLFPTPLQSPTSRPCVLGRGPINAQPYAYGCKLDECKVVGRELVVTCCHTPAVLDLFEKPLDQIASSVKVRTEA